MKIAVVGAAGATGRRAVKHALEQGHVVTAVARRPERLSSCRPAVHRPGDVLSPGGLTAGVAGILAECRCASVRRFVLHSGIGLGYGREPSCPNRPVVRMSGRILTAAIIDKAVAERMTPGRIGG
ncbi:MAG: NAD(P)H-binding protein [Bryobacteraceae bacterium]